MAPEPTRDLENRELACPSSEASIAPKLRELAQYSERSLIGGFAAELVDLFLSAVGDARSPSRGFGPRNAQKQRVQAGNSRFVRLTLIAQIANPRDGLQLRSRVDHAQWYDTGLRFRQCCAART